MRLDEIASERGVHDAISAFVREEKSEIETEDESGDEQQENQSMIFTQEFSHCGVVTVRLSRMFPPGGSEISAVRTDGTGTESGSRVSGRCEDFMGGHWLTV